MSNTNFIAPKASQNGASDSNHFVPSVEQEFGFIQRPTKPQRAGRFRPAKLRANREPLTPILSGKALGEFKEFPVPENLLKDGKLTLTFDPLPEEAQLNWR